MQQGYDSTCKCDQETVIKMIHHEEKNIEDIQKRILNEKLQYVKNLNEMSDEIYNIKETIDI